MQTLSKHYCTMWWLLHLKMPSICSFCFYVGFSILWLGLGWWGDVFSPFGVGFFWGWVGGLCYIACMIWFCCVDTWICVVCFGHGHILHRGSCMYARVIWYENLHPHLLFFFLLYNSDTSLIPFLYRLQNCFVKLVLLPPCCSCESLLSLLDQASKRCG